MCIHCENGTGKPVPEFRDYMDAQVKAIRESGMTSTEWVKKHAEQFRKDYYAEDKRRCECIWVETGDDDCTDDSGSGDE